MGLPCGTVKVSSRLKTPVTQCGDNSTIKLIIPRIVISLCDDCLLEIEDDVAQINMIVAKYRTERKVYS